MTTNSLGYTSGKLLLASIITLCSMASGVYAAESLDGKPGSERSARNAYKPSRTSGQTATGVALHNGPNGGTNKILTSKHLINGLLGEGGQSSQSSLTWGTSRTGHGHDGYQVDKGTASQWGKYDIAKRITTIDSPSGPLFADSTGQGTSGGSARSAVDAFKPGGGSVRLSER